MSAKSFKFLYFYFISSLLLTLITLFILNPNFESYGVETINKFVFYKPNFFKINPESNLEIAFDSPSYQYRNDSQRTGFYEINFNPLDLNATYLNNVTVNHGGHKASKSTPVSNEEYIVSAGDQGLVQVFKNEILHWTLKLYNSNLGFHGTPILFKHYAILGEYSGRLYFLNLLDKKIIWMGHFGNSFGATPWLEDHYLYYNVETLHPDGYLGKIDLLNTKLVWVSSSFGDHSHSSPALDENNLYVGDNKGGFQATSKLTGQTVWSVGFSSPIKSTPALDNNNIYVSSWDGYLYSLSKKNGFKKWKYKLSKFNQSSLALDSELGVGFINDSNGLHKVNLKSGQRLAIMEMKMGREVKKSSPVILKFKGQKYVASGCFETDVCIFDFNTLKVLRKYIFKQSLSSQIGVNKKYLMLALNKDTPLILLKPTNILK